MVFSSLLFLYAFFAASLLVYWLCPGRKLKNASLLLFSLAFYAWGEPKYVLLLLFMSFVSWICALGVERSVQKEKKKGRNARKKCGGAWVAVAAVVDIALIGFFKYSGMICSIFGDVPEFIANIALPIGISFYTFQLLTYVVDVYRREAPAQKNYFNVLLYAALFHQCIAGPIVRYQTVAEELFSDKPRQPEVAQGVSRFCIGLAKKALLANACGALAETLLLSDAALADATKFAANQLALSQVSVLGAWVGMIAYSLQIYLDFSAYSDMAIGMGKMIGLHYLENFNYPYISRSVTEFWRRWHMSLGTFFRDYVYIPMGGSRCGFLRAAFNTFVVWFLTGLWHGASWNFVLWGLWFFVFLMIERLGLKRILQKVPVLSNLYLLFVVIIGWVIFRFTNVELGITMLKSMFGLNGNELASFANVTLLKNNLYLLVVSMVACVPLVKWIQTKMVDLGTQSGLVRGLWNFIVYSLIPVILLLLATATLVGDTYNPFIYFQF